MPRPGPAGTLDPSRHHRATDTRTTELEQT